MLEKLGPQGAWRNVMRKERKSPNTDWLDGSELAKLITKLELDIPIGIFGDYQAAQLDPKMKLNEALQTIEAFTNAQVEKRLEKLIEIASKKDDFIGGVLIYQPLTPSALQKLFAATYSTLQDWLSLISRARLYRPQQSVRGHWISLAVISLGGKRQYLVIDSGGNITRLYDKKVEQMIMLIENKRLDSEPSVDNYQEEATALKELHKKVSIVAFEQKREILGRIETQERYRRSKNILIALLVIGALYYYYYGHLQHTDKEHEELLSDNAIFS